MSMADPGFHRQREQELIAHIERLLHDERLRVETIGGRRSIATLRRDVTRQDHEVDLKRLMSQMGIYDREIQQQMPVGQELSVVLSATIFLFFRRIVGHMKVISVPPSESLLKNETPRPLDVGDLKEAIERASGSGRFHDAPVTLVVLSTSGFTPEAMELAQTRGHRTVALVWPRENGGWQIKGPAEMESALELLDPEPQVQKRKRIREEIERHRPEILSGGLDALRLAEKTDLPLWVVEDELQLYAQEAGDVTVRRLEGKLMVFREGYGPLGASGAAGGLEMPFLERVKALFARKGDNGRKIALLSERRATLSLQRDRAFEEMGLLEQREADLRRQFKDSGSPITKRRITSQLVQLRKDLERRQQLMGVLNQQINVIATHLHNLQLIQQGQSASLPDSDELAEDAAAAEEILSQLQEDNELAGSIGAAAPSGMTDEEQALYEELEREAGTTAEEDVPQVELPEPSILQRRETQSPPPIPEEEEMELPPPPPIPARRERGEAEPG